jgi:CDGSH-type Zn-finger protein
MISNKNNDSADVNHHQMTPKILPLLNGPYYLINDMKPTVVENLQNSNGEPLSTVRGVALCRCGASKNKPFCDGTHGTIRFSSLNKTLNETDNEKRIKDKRRNYFGKEITIHDNRKICSHAAECVDNLPSVFKLNERPWIDPDGARIQEVINTIRKCPSGALSFSIGDTEHRDPEDKRNPIVTVSKNGPYHISGGIELLGEGVEFGEGASMEHYALCRCGASENKPFCDGAHRNINFNDG